MKYGRKGHGDNVEQDRFNAYVEHIIKNMKLGPNKSAKLKIFEAMTKNVSDQEKLKQAIKEKWV